jgi:hypothetical protein
VSLSNDTVGKIIFYYKYIIDLESVNDLSYYYIMKELIAYTLVITLLLFWGFFFSCVLILYMFPKTKVSDLIRKHVITDRDLEDQSPL